MYRTFNKIVNVLALLAVIAGIVVFFWQQRQASIPEIEVDQYVNETYGFTFDYPSQYVLRRFTPEYIVIGKRTEAGLQGLASVTVLAAEKGAYPEYSQFVQAVAEGLCGTDDPARALMCPDRAKQKAFRTKHGLAGESFNLVEQSRMLPAGATTTIERGPFTAFNLSPNVPRAGFATVLVGVPVGTTTTREQLDIAHIVASSMRIHATGTQPTASRATTTRATTTSATSTRR